jgi:uncharacterized Zn finger protein
MSSEPSDAPSSSAAGGRVLRASLPCEVCGRDTPHRLLRVTSGALARAVRGTARCQVCGWTHPFESIRPESAEVSLIVSVGARSDRSIVVLPGGTRLAVGGRVPEQAEALRIQRLDGRDGRPLSGAPARSVATVWAVRDVGTVIPVSIVQGRTTRTARLAVAPESEFRVGGRVTVDGTRLEIVAIRARGHTWRRPGDAFAASDVQRLYGRRSEIPPAGSRAWSRVRGTPRAFESSTSRSARSRSGPGVSRKRTEPSARTDAGGATVHRSAPS